MWIAIAVGAAIAALAHTAPAPFLLDALAGRRSIWHMPKSDPPTIYFTYDDGPNPATTPALLDVLPHEGVRATFFLIDRHINDGTAPLVSRMFADGHTAGAIVVMHDGDESAPLAEQRHTVEVTARLIPALRAKGFAFGTVCDQSGLVNTGAR